MSDTKKCKECWEEFTRYNTIQNKCNSCIIKKNNQKSFNNFDKIKNKYSSNKNTKAKFLVKIKLIIKDRDKVCILCWDEWSDYHHAFYGSMYAIYWPDRNNSDQWVLLCQKCHHEIHHWKDWKWQSYRARCIVYLKQLK